MKFLIQLNGLREEQLQKIQPHIQAYPHEYISVIPFSHEIISDTPLDGRDYIPYGSTTLINLAYERRWRGLAFDPYWFNYERALLHRNDMLNTGVMTMRQALYRLRQSDPNQSWFLRPSDDLKYFSGQVQTAKEFCTWLESAMETASSESGVIDPSMSVVLSDVKSLKAEVRWFIVNGRVITGSFYRMDGQSRQMKITDSNLITEAQVMADQWLPKLNCVMDVALLETGELKVIEFNCINGSGLYHHDVRALFSAWWTYYQDFPNI